MLARSLATQDALARESNHLQANSKSLHMCWRTPLPRKIMSKSWHSHSEDSKFIHDNCVSHAHADALPCHARSTSTGEHPCAKQQAFPLEDACWRALLPRKKHKHGRAPMCKQQAFSSVKAMVVLARSLATQEAQARESTNVQTASVFYVKAMALRMLARSLATQEA